MRWHPAWLCVLAVHCGSPDPRSMALEAWEEGSKLLEARDGVGAALRFEEALALDPRSVALHSAYAEALAVQGELEAAVAAIDAGLSHAPRNAIFHYNRAAYLARLERFGDAHQSLLVALSLRSDLHRRASADKDFSVLSERVPQLFRSTELAASAVGEAGSVLLGEPYELVLTAQMPTGDPLEVFYAGAAVPPFRLIRAIETIERGQEKDVVTLTWSLVALEAGNGMLGPWMVRSGGQGSMAAAVPFEVVSAGAARAWGPGSPALALAPQPSRLLRATTSAEVSSALVDDWVVVAHPPELRVEAVEGLRGEGVRLAYRGDVEPARAGTAWLWAPQAQRASVRLEGATLLEITRRD
jgi:hypothetical protein